MSSDGVGQEFNNMTEYRLNIILNEVKKINDELKVMNNEIVGLKTQIKVLEVTLNFKSGLWGALAGAVPVLLMIAIWYLQQGTKI